jgi:hypothetical protein
MDPFDSSEGEVVSRWLREVPTSLSMPQTRALVWYLKDDRQSGKDNIVGAGVATVIADSNGPNAAGQEDSMWNSWEPYWGDIGAYET